MTLAKAPRVAQKKFSEFENFYYIRRQKTDDFGPRFKKSPTEFLKFNFWVSHLKAPFFDDIFVPFYSLKLLKLQVPNLQSHWN